MAPGLAGLENTTTVTLWCIPAAWSVTQRGLDHFLHPSWSLHCQKNLHIMNSWFTYSGFLDPYLSSPLFLKITFYYSLIFNVICKMVFYKLCSYCITPYPEGWNVFLFPKMSNPTPDFLGQSPLTLLFCGLHQKVFLLLTTSLPIAGPTSALSHHLS